MAYSVSRRSLLQLLSALLIFGPGRGLLADQNSVNASFDDIIARRVNFLTGNAGVENSAALDASLRQFSDSVSSSYASLNTSSQRTSLWNDLPVNQYGSVAGHSKNVNVSFDRLSVLAQGYAVSGTAFYRNEALKNDIVSAFHFITAIYAGKKRSGNWWYLEIGIPRAGLNLAYLLKDALDPADIADFLDACLWYVPVPDSRERGTTDVETGANRADKALNFYLIALLQQNSVRMKQARDALYDVKSQNKYSLFTLVNAGDGFYADGSFIQHSTIPYIGSYGAVLFSSLGEMLMLLSGTDIDIGSGEKAFLYQLFNNNVTPFIWRGRVLDTVRGRAVSRQFSKDYNAGFALIHALLVVFNGETPARKSTVYSAARSWLKQLDHAPADDPGLTIPQKKLLQSVIDDEAWQAEEAAPSFTRIFPAQERIVHAREQWLFTVNLSSKWISRMEWGNGENVKGWNQGDGMTFLYLNDDADQFSDNFWPTVDPGALPGITVDGVNLEGSGSGSSAGTSAPLGGGSYSGGIVLNARYGTVAMEDISYSTRTRSLKSWFTLDDAVICVGSDIKGTSGTAVRTVVENRGFTPGSLPDIRVDNAPVSVSEGRVLAVAKSLHVAGIAGYVLLDERPATLRYQLREGSWRSINLDDTVGDAQTFQRGYLSLEIAHGTDPQADTCAWMVLPGASAEATRQRAIDSGVSVTHAGGAHIVQVPALGATLGHFFSAGTAQGIRSSAPCAFGWQADREEQRLILSMSSPATSTASRTVTLTLPESVAAGEALAVPDGVTIVSLAPVTVQMTVPGRDRAQRVIVFSLT